MRRALIVCCIAMMAGSAAAQDLEAGKKESPEVEPAEPKPEQPDQMQMPERHVEWTFKPRMQMGFNSGFDGAPGDVTVTRVGADLGVEIPVATMSALEFGFEFEYSRYDFTGATGFVGGTGSPFQDVHRQVFRARYGQQQTMQLSWFVAGYAGWSGEDDADLDQSVIAGIYGGVGYYLSRDVRIGAALGVFSRIEDDPLVIPIPALDWKLDEQWRISTAGKPGLTVFYSPTERWTLSLGAWYDERNFRLDESGPVPNGVGRESSVPVEFGIVFRPMPNLEVNGALGARVLNNYEIDSATGATLADIDADPSAYLGFGVTIKF
jgi:hypothetical protein